MSASSMQTKNDQLLIVDTRNGQALGCRVLDFADPGSYPPLFKELGFRCVAAHPEYAGQPWRAALEMEGLGTAAPRVRMEGWSKDRDPQLLASLHVPVNNFAWLGVALARQLGLQDPYAVNIAVTNRRHAVVEQWMNIEDEDFVLERNDAAMVLPAEFDIAELGRRRIIHRRGTFLRCVFTGEVYEQFTAAAAAETQNEQGWLGQVRTHLAEEGICYIVIDGLVEAPASQRGRGFLRTPGRQFGRLYQQHERLGGYLHLHPRDVDGAQLSPLPSGPDNTLAWNLDACVSSMIVMPIALFGFRSQQAARDMAVCGFLNGILVPIDLEVLCDDSS